MNNLKKFNTTLARILSFILLFSLSFSNLTFAAETQEIVLYDFQNDEEILKSWSVDNDLALSINESEDGNKSLKAEIPLVTSDKEQTFTFNTFENISDIKKGDVISFDVYLSEDCVASVQPYYMGWKSEYIWQPERGKWNSHSITVTDDSVSEIGLQIIAFKNASGYVLIDNVKITRNNTSTTPPIDEDTNNPSEEPDNDNSDNSDNNTDDYNTLSSIIIFDSTVANGTDFWSSGPIELEDCNNGWKFFPIKTESPYTYKGNPSIKVSQLEPGYFGAGIAFNGWGSINLSKYYENGYLEFYAAGEIAGESIAIQFTGNENAPYTTIKLDTDSTIGNDSIETKWQYFKIPLKELLSDSNDAVSQLKFTNDWANNVKQAMYLSEIKVSTTDTETVYPLIKVNQLGYFPNAEKTATISRFKELVTFDENTNFNVINATTNEIAYTGKLKLVTDYDYLSGEKVFKADFSELKATGEYYITIDGLDEKSYTFEISNDVYDDLLAAAVKYYYYQRSGIDLTPEYAGQWSHDAFFMGDLAREGVNELELPIQSTMNTDNVEYLQNEGIEKGWFDAGDYGKYVDNGAYTVKKLLYMYETYPELFKDNIGIPESGNGIPDILDEVAWELDFFLAMQDEDGGIYHSVEGLNVDPFRPENYGDYNRHIADVDSKTGQTGVKPTHTTAIAASALAQASVIYKSINADYSKKLLDAALKAWSYLEENLEPLTVTGPAYSDTRTDSVQRLAAASSLYRATGDEKFNTYVLNHYDDFVLENNNVIDEGDLEEDLHSLNSGYFNDMWTAENTSLILYDYMVSKNSDTTVAKFIKSQYLEYETALQNRVVTSPWSNTSNGNLFWGSNGAVISRASTHLDIFGELFGTYSDASRSVAINNMNYLLGINPLNLSFVTGYGENSVKEVFGNTFMNDDNDISAPGYMPGGVNRYQGDKISKFPGKRYEEGINWVTNEHCIDYTCNLVGAIASAIAAATDKAENSIIIKNINDIKTEITEGDNYTLPTSLKAFLVDGSEINVNINWSESVDTTKIGEQVIYGSVNNYNELVKATITINKKSSDDNISKPDDDTITTPLDDVNNDNNNNNDNSDKPNDNDTIINPSDDANNNNNNSNNPSDSTTTIRPSNDSDNAKDLSNTKPLPNTGGLNPYSYIMFSIILVTSGIILFKKKPEKAN